ncbi:MAG: 3-hydroxyacyl-CoA dehydrogenase/enoyl-CoA hydratase family protein [Ferruginibacter sp.]|nr:3-hydroxyacyl-CoA dehydrogenase/enoyl-CoA hydratase family protein [Ferruginibacter sp.]
MQKRTIKKVAVLGSGVMGSRIALHFAGIGLPVLLLDILHKDSSEIKERNAIVNEALQTAVKSNPSPVYHKRFITNIQTGNFTDNMKDISDADWIIEVVVEKLNIKQQIFEQVEKYRKPSSIVSSNTSGIPIQLMAEGRSDDFKNYFCGTHFFNPPRYLRLLEIIPTTYTNRDVVDFLLHYGDVFLGKTTVLCKDTPAFIANRIGVFSIMNILHAQKKLRLSVDELDTLTGTVIGRPKSATFRTADVVGLDTLVKVANGIHANCPNDEAKALFEIPGWMNEMIAKNMLGDKTAGGFYKKVKQPDGSKQILVLDLDSMEYRLSAKPKFSSLENTKNIDDLGLRLKTLSESKDTAGDFYRIFHYGLFSYISHRIPEISDDIYQIDEALKAGFGWEIGAFESWDALGVSNTVKEMKDAGYSVAHWIDEMLNNGHHSFYKLAEGKRLYYNVISKGYKHLHDNDAFLVMKNFINQTVWKNNLCRAYHLGEDVLGLEWYTKMGNIGSEVLEAIQHSISLAESDYKGLVISNNGPNFSAGGNIAMMFMLSLEQEFDELDMSIRVFQQSIMRIRYSSIPVVIAPSGLALGGGCEILLHADKVIAAPETYTGLVEGGIGLIPAGGGTKEFILRAFDETHVGEPEYLTLQQRFLHIATAKVSTSAHEAYDLGILRKGQDEICYNSERRIARAKQTVIDLFDKGYVMPLQRKDIKVPGRNALGTLYSGINGMRSGNYISDHDVLIAKKLAMVMCGGDLSEYATVSEQYLLDLEREAFLSLCSERKTLERIQYMLKSGKPFRN